MRDEWGLPFDLKFLEQSQYPSAVGFFDPDPVDFPKDCRVLHYQVKARNTSDLVLGELEWLRSFISESYHRARLQGVDTDGRYTYVTVDQGLVEAGGTLRTAGWHIDGLQGDEVPVKVPGDCQFIWSDAVPTEFVTHPFSVDGIDVSKHNVFDRLAVQVRESRIRKFTPGFVMLHNSYLVHRAGVAEETTYRRFVRVSHSYVPVTSVKMTINPDMEYDFPVHTTSGEIPAHLM